MPSAASLIAKIADPLPNGEAARDFDLWAASNRLPAPLLSHIAFIDTKRRVIYCSEVVQPAEGFATSVRGEDFLAHGLAAGADGDRLVVERVYPLRVDPPSSILEQ